MKTIDNGMPKPMISVIMGIYNEQNQSQVMKAVESVLDQTYGEFEFIICDDGSEKRFYNWLEHYCRKDTRIRLLRKEQNGGLAAALNACLAEANGDYIARMDADDLSKPDRFERQLDFLIPHPEYALLGCGAELIDEEGIWGRRIPTETPQKRDFLWSSPFIHPTIMIRKAVLEELGGYETEAYAERTEDYDLFMRLYASGYQGYNLQECLFQYREDRKAYTKRKYKYRINEAKVRYRGYRSLGILPGHFHNVIKPLIVGLIPVSWMQKVRKKQFGK